jgi:hypothetical protein
MKEPGYAKWMAYAQMGGKLDFDGWVRAGRPLPTSDPTGERR